MKKLGGKQASDILHVYLKLQFEIEVYTDVCVQNMSTRWHQCECVLLLCTCSTSYITLPPKIVFNVTGTVSCQVEVMIY